MRLNPDCTRDVLMYFEENTTAHGLLECSAQSLLKQSEKLSQYSAEEILYHVSQCALSGFLVGYQEDCSGNFLLLDISPKAHDFLANIRSDSVWDKTKNVAGKIGTTSLNALCQIASSVVTEIVKSQLGL